MNIEQYKHRFFNLMESTIGDVKPLISEQTQPKEFIIGNAKYRIENITKLQDDWNRIEFVKLMPNGTAEKQMKIGYVSLKKPKTILKNYKTPNNNPYYSDNTFGVSNEVLVQSDDTPTNNNENTREVTDGPKNFRIGSDVYKVTKILTSPNWSIGMTIRYIEYAKVLSDGSLDKKINHGFYSVRERPNTFIYEDEELHRNGRIGPVIFDGTFHWYLESLKDGLSKMFNNQKVEISDDGILSVGNVMKLKLGKETIKSISIGEVKMINGQILPSQELPLNIIYVNNDLNKILLQIKNKFAEIQKKQSSSFKTTVRDKQVTKPNLPNQGKPLDI
jgi:hypothetical protein